LHINGAQKRRRPHDLSDLLAMLGRLPAGQRRVALALVLGPSAPTYPEVAARLGVHVGTVHRHLGRVRAKHPEVYAALMAERRWQLERRHERAVERAERRSAEWHRRQANRRYRARYGRWPWEPRW